MNSGYWHNAAGRSVLPYVLFGSFWIASCAVFWRELAATFSLALRNEQYTHILLVLPISAALIYSEWNFRSSNSRVRRGLGACLLSVGTAIAAASAWFRQAPDIHLSAAMLALVFLWIGSFIFLFGEGFARLPVFPLAFLLWLVPLPSIVLIRIVQWLQQGSSMAAGTLFSAAGIPASRDGIVLAIPGLTLEVASECSSIRSSLMLLVTTMVLAHLLLRSPRRRLLLILLAVPLSVAKNGLRIFTLAILGTRLDRGFLTGRLHREGGIVFFLIALALVLTFLWFLRRSEALTNTSHRARQHPSGSPRLMPRDPLISCLLLKLHESAILKGHI